MGNTESLYSRFSSLNTTRMVNRADKANNKVKYSVTYNAVCFNIDKDTWQLVEKNGITNYNGLKDAIAVGMELASMKFKDKTTYFVIRNTDWYKICYTDRDTKKYRGRFKI